MSGLDNIVEEIRNQSKQEADEILKEADVFCKDYMNKIKKDVEVEVVSIEKKALADRKLMRRRRFQVWSFWNVILFLGLSSRLLNRLLIRLGRVYQVLMMKNILTFWRSF